MRFKESLKLDRLIDRRRESLARYEGLELEKRAQALAVLIEARKQLDEIGRQKQPQYVQYHQRFTGTDENGRKIRPRKRRASRRQHNIDDLQRNYEQRLARIDVITEPLSGAELGRKLRKELRRSAKI
ncbi:MAG: hypothetical protein ACW987_20080 [Candidatus Thorarchaeota archaeon]|jgi:hypothetical protein